MKSLDSGFCRNDGNCGTLQGIKSAGTKTQEKDRTPESRLAPLNCALRTRQRRDSTGRAPCFAGLGRDDDPASGGHKALPYIVMQRGKVSM